MDKFQHNEMEQMVLSQLQEITDELFNNSKQEMNGRELAMLLRNIVVKKLYDAREKAVSLDFEKSEIERLKNRKDSPF